MAVIYGDNFNNSLVGTSVDDIIRGRGGNDTLESFAGNDRLDGGAGIDAMRGGVGNDTYYVDNQEDTVIELAGEGFDTVRTDTHFSLAWGQSIEQLYPTIALGTAPLSLIGNDLANRIGGNAGDNYIRGGPGGDILLGMAGDDVLIGDIGKDRLRGGDGNDTFVFTDAEDARDVIYDFVSGSDHIDLGWWVTEMGGADFNFIGGAAFGHHAGEGRFANGVFAFDANGDGVADLTITVVGSLAASDFIFAAMGYWDY